MENNLYIFDGHGLSTTDHPKRQNIHTSMPHFPTGGDCLGHCYSRWTMDPQSVEKLKLRQTIKIYTQLAKEDGNCKIHGQSSNQPMTDSHN
jgi:hypothetical protein